MKIRVRFFSYYKEKTGCETWEGDIAEPCLLGQLLDQVEKQFPALAPFRKSTLVAVGVEYQTADYRLQEGDEVALFPPVQGG